MFSRNALHIARRGREVEVWIDGLDVPRVGFLAGLDEQYVQVCLTDKQTLSNIRKSSILSMDETGNTLGKYIKAGSLDPETIKRIEEKISGFRKRASYLAKKNVSV